jgi:hypothetical protein
VVVRDDGPRRAHALEGAPNKVAAAAPAAVVKSKVAVLTQR